MASPHLIEEQPKSVSSFDSVETKAKSVQLLENIDRFIIQRFMTPGEGKLLTILLSDSHDLTHDLGTA